MYVMCTGTCMLYRYHMYECIYLPYINLDLKVYMYATRTCTTDPLQVVHVVLVYAVAKYTTVVVKYTTVGKNLQVL